MADNVSFINCEQGARAMRLCWKAEVLARSKGLGINVPLVFVGTPGSGKTTIPINFIESLNGEAKKYKLWMVPVSYLADAGDIGGLPVPDREKKVMDFLMSVDLPFDTEETGVVVLDELDSNKDENVQNSLLQVLLGRRIHGHVLSPKAYVMGTMNGASDMYTMPLREAARTRIVTAFVSQRADGSTDAYCDWAQQKGLSTVIRTFAKYRSELLADDPTFEELAVYRRRSGDMADLIWQAAQDAKFKVDDIMLPLIAGCIGREAAVEFLATEQLIREAPPIDDVLKHPDKAKIPDNPSVLYALICTLTDVAERANVDAIAEYGVRLPAEFAAALFRPVIKKPACAVIVTSKCFLKWKKEHAALLF